MYIYIQEKQTKRTTLGCYKEITLGTKKTNGILVNTYEFSGDRFIRPPKSSYVLTLKDSYRENRKLYKYQKVITTLSYYDIAESYADEYKDIFDNQLIYDIFTKIDKIAKPRLIQKYPKESFVQNYDYENYEEYIEDFAYEIRKSFLDKYYNKLEISIITEFQKTEEYQVLEKHRLEIKNYEDRKSKFISIYDASPEEYNICYDFYGNLTNKFYLDKIKNRSSGYTKNKYNTYTNTKYDDSEKVMLKKFYKMLGTKFHPDSNPNVDTTKEMQLINKLRNDWGI